jgi:membrane protein DedA with SNARE-associated domain
MSVAPPCDPKGPRVTLSTDLLMSLFIVYGYWIVFTAILLDNAGLPIPGELMLVALGAVARAGHLDVVVGLAVATTAALVGDSLGYWLGRLGGRRMLARFGRRPWFAPGHLSVVLGRFVVGARVLVAPLAGVAHMPFARFLAVDAVGCLVWASAFILIGYASELSLEVMHQGLRLLGVAVLGVLAAGIASSVILRALAARRRRAAA